MKTQKIQLAHNLPYKKTTAKYITVVRILFNKEFTKIDFGFDASKIRYIKDGKLLINPVLLKTPHKEYKLLSVQIFKKPFFQKDSDYRYFSLLFEPIDEDLECFDIVDTAGDKILLPFGFQEICLY